MKLEEEDDRIFVFGSNLAGRHGRGAAIVPHGDCDGEPRGGYLPHFKLSFNRPVRELSPLLGVMVHTTWSEVESIDPANLVLFSGVVVDVIAAIPKIEKT